MSISFKIIFTFALLVAGIGQLDAQILKDALKHNEVKSTDSLLNMDANTNRPTVHLGNTPVSIGGYFEANSIYAIEEGDSEGLAFQLRRLSIVLATPITKHINFMSEIEFEDQGKEVSIEYAAIDVNLFTELNFRGGLIEVGS